MTVRITMQVAMYYNNRDVRLEQLPKPEVADDELLFKVKASGVCGTDVLEWYRLKRAPLVLGHEACGQIVEVGKNVKQYKIGERVFVAHHVPCNSCRYCLAGHHTVCETLHTTNYYPGGFSEYVRVPKINVERGVFLLPPEISFEEGTFIEPLACVIRGQRLSGFKPEQTVLILGAGISGLLHLLLARSAGASRVILTDINEYRLKTAKGLGASAVINAREDVPATLRKFNDGRLTDLVVVSTGALSAFSQAMQSVERAGTILCFAAPEPEVSVPLPVNDFWRKSIRVAHSYGSSPSDTQEAIELLRKKKIPVDKLITHRLSLQKAQEAFRLVAEAKECIKVIITP